MTGERTIFQVERVYGGQWIARPEEAFRYEDAAVDYAQWLQKEGRDTRVVRIKVVA